MKAVHTFKMSGINNHAAWYSSAEDMNPGHHCCSGLISVTSIVFAESLLNSVV
jgi:hypothetical protein